MNVLIEGRLIELLTASIRRRHLPNGNYTDSQIEQYDRERLFLLAQLHELSVEDAWWSDPEWEWFLNRCLDFLEVS